MKKKILTTIPLILIIAFGVLAIRLFVIITPQGAQKVDTSKGVQVVKSMYEQSADKAQKEVLAAQEKYNAEKQRKKVAKALKDGNYKFAFKGLVICGDSTIAAIEEYGILDGNSIVAKIGAGTTYLNQSINTLVKKKPKYLVLHFGENQINTPRKSQYLIKPYTKCIQQLKKKLPNTEIYVDSIFPVLPKAYKEDSYLKNVSYYNEELKKMAEQTGVHYMDSEALWKSFKKNYYDLDGIHPLYSFYTEQYLAFVLQEVGAYD